MIYQDVIEYIFENPGVRKAIDKFSELENNNIINSINNNYSKTLKILQGLGMYLDVMDIDEFERFTKTGDNYGFYMKYDEGSYTTITFSERKIPLVLALLKAYNISTDGMESVI